MDASPTEAVVAGWTVEQVVAWLRDRTGPVVMSIGEDAADGTAEIVEAQDIDGHVLLNHLSYSSLTDVLKLTYGKASKLWDAINTLRGPPTSAGVDAIQEMHILQPAANILQPAARKSAESQSGNEKKRAQQHRFELHALSEKQGVTRDDGEALWRIPV